MLSAPLLYQSSDMSRDVVVNEEISEMSDSIKQLATDVGNIQNSQRNKAKSLQSASGLSAQILMSHFRDHNIYHNLLELMAGVCQMRK